MHRDLNVKANNERGWDWTGANLLQTPPTQQSQNGYHTPPQTNPLAVAPEDAPTGQLRQGLGMRPATATLHRRVAGCCWLPTTANAATTNPASLGRPELGLIQAGLNLQGEDLNLHNMHAQ